MPHPPDPNHQNDLESRLQDLENVTLDCKKEEVEDALDDGDLDEAESLIDELESERM